MSANIDPLHIPLTPPTTEEQLKRLSDRVFSLEADLLRAVDGVVRLADAVLQLTNQVKAMIDD